MRAPIDQPSRFSSERFSRSPSLDTPSRLGELRTSASPARGSAVSPCKRTRCDAARSGGKAPVLFSAPRTRTLQRSASCAWGSQLFSQGLLQQLLAKHLVGEHAFETSVSGLLATLVNSFCSSLSCLAWATSIMCELALPAMEGLLAYLLIPAHVQDRLVRSFSFPERPDLLSRGVSFAFLRMGPF